MVQSVTLAAPSSSAKRKRRRRTKVAMLSSSQVSAIASMKYDHRPYIRTNYVEVSFFSELFAGLRYVFAHRILLSVLSISDC
jgi:hypothetical protein